MYLTISTITDYSTSVNQYKNIKISQTLEEARECLSEELLDQNLSVGENEEDYMNCLHYARAWDEQNDCEIVWEITKINLNEYIKISEKEGFYA